jgi:hypothetical protein
LHLSKLFSDISRVTLYYYKDFKGRILYAKV